MAHFIVEALETRKVTYLVEAEDDSTAVEFYFDDNKKLVQSFSIGELFEDVNEVCCEDHYENILKSISEQSEEMPEIIGTIN